MDRGEQRKSQKEKTVINAGTNRFCRLNFYILRQFLVSFRQGHLNLICPSDGFKRIGIGVVSPPVRRLPYCCDSILLVYVCCNNPLCSDEERDLATLLVFQDDTDTPFVDDLDSVPHGRWCAIKPPFFVDGLSDDHEFGWRDGELNLNLDIDASRF